MDAVEQTTPAKKLKLERENASSNKPLEYTRPVQENDVGITQYYSTRVGFSGIVKHRYSDFIVNEIDKDGNIVKLTDTEIPEEMCISESVNSFENPLTIEDQSALANLQSSDDVREVTLNANCSDKERRTHLHNAIKLNFPDLDSNTTEIDGIKVIVVKKKKSQSQPRRQWPKSRPSYLQFVLYKENKDTMDALDFLSKLLHVKSHIFSYSGTKDRRAKTSQLITAYKLEVQKLKAIESKLQNIVVGNFKYVDEQLRLGDNSGNRFTILLRNVQGSDKDIVDSLNLMKERGFINYYGLQRFGTTAVPTYHVGRALLCSQWKDAVDLILQPRPGDRPAMQEARMIWKTTGDAKAALTKLPKYNSTEKNLLRHLTKYGGTNFCNSLNALPRNLRLMYVHSYQSYIWNTVVSRRLSQYGHKVMLGDLVLNDPGSGIKPIVVDESNINDYSIYDVVFPLPGCSVNYPQNEVHDWYKELLSADGLDVSNMKHKIKEYSLPGSYRHILVHAKDMTWTFMRYNDTTAAIIHSDWEMLNGQNENASTDGKFLAIKLEFSLPSSTYATMAIREVLRHETFMSHDFS